MKSLLFVCLSFLFTGVKIIGQNNLQVSDSVEVIGQFKNLYHFQNFYISGQPTYEAMQWLKSKGVSKIINLRSEKENSEFSSTAFNEESVAKDQGLEYCSLQVDGMKDNTPAKLDDFIKLLNRNETILIHCASAIRATNFFMAYLVKNRGYSIDQAVEIGKKLNFSFPLEKLLDTEISMETRH